MINKLTVALTVPMIVLLLTVSCGPPELTPTTTEEAQIPPHFATYTSEGLFSISYPPDWVPATSIIEEMSEMMADWAQGVDPNLSMEDFTLMFLAGKPIEEGYYPAVTISTMPRSIGLWTLDEITEADDLWCREHLQQYREHSRTKTVIGGNEAAISDWQDYEPVTGTWRYLTAYVVKDKFCWTVTCGVEVDDFKTYEDTFNSVVRSFRPLR